MKIDADHQNAEVISDTLMALGALSASIEDAHAETAAEQAIFGEPGDPPPGIWQQSIVTAMFEEGTDTAAILASLRTETGIAAVNSQIETIADQDWVRSTQSQFEPIAITNQLWIVPSWHQAPDPAAINIVLDPGLAFGTGSHPTTHLCLAWLTQQTPLNTVLDYGCGSGILAIAAKKLGAQQVLGVDIDEQAIIASQFNAGQNQVEIDFSHADTPLTQTFDVVVANILSSALMVLAPVLARACRAGGKIALSGILEEQTAVLQARYAEWFDMHTPVQKEAWILLTGTKR